MGGVSLITVEALFLVVTAWLAVFAQSWFGGIRVLTGAQVDVLPSLMVYAGLTGGMWSVGLLSFFAGTLLDSLSLNPLGVSVFPLFVVGWAVNANQELILRTERYAQCLLGIGAGALVPLLTLSIIVFLMGERVERPVVGWESLWRWTVMALAGGVATPVIFLFGDLSRRMFLYEMAPENRFRGDREIKRWRV